MSDHEVGASWGDIYRQSCIQFADLYGFAFHELVRAMGSEEAATAIAADAVMDIVRQACERAHELSISGHGAKPASMVLQFEMGLADGDDEQGHDTEGEE